jgi:hypothetical protein
MPVTEKFKEDSAIAAIRALRGLEQTAIMLEAYAPEIFPETKVTNGVEQRPFGRVMMESAAQAIREAWATAIKETENSTRAEHVVAFESMKDLAWRAAALLRFLRQHDGECLGDHPDWIKRIDDLLAIPSLETE